MYLQTCLSINMDLGINLTGDVGVLGIFEKGY